MLCNSHFWTTSHVIQAVLDLTMSVTITLNLIHLLLSPECWNLERSNLSLAVLKQALLYCGLLGHELPKVKDELQVLVLQLQPLQCQG